MAFPSINIYLCVYVCAKSTCFFEGVVSYLNKLINYDTLLVSFIILNYVVLVAA